MRGIAQRLWSLFEARLMRGIGALWRRGPPEEGVLAKFKHLSARGTDTLVVMSSQDDGLDYVEFHLGRRGSQMKRQRNFRMVMIEDSDHTFTTVASQRAVIEIIVRHVESQHGQAREWPAIAARVATT